MGVYCLITTSLISSHFELRKQQYTIAITSAIKHFSEITNCKIIIIENTNSKGSFLEDFGIPVFYTNNNSIQTNNKGIKELQDVFDAIQEYSIQDDDFIVKLTGRYILQEKCPFFEKLKKLSESKYEGIVKYGAYTSSMVYTSKHNDCYSGLVGLLCKYVKQIQMPTEMECVEWKWADAINILDESRICILTQLGLLAAVGSFSVHYQQQ